VRPCFFHPAIGKIGPETGLATVLNGPRAAAFRTTLKIETNPICRQCVCSLNWKPVANHPISTSTSVGPGTLSECLSA
jgi:hypothetical protein